MPRGFAIGRDALKLGKTTGKRGEVKAEEPRASALGVAVAVPLTGRAVVDLN
ncbi:hypothetical protein SPHINGO391_410101 [Sphingomonas aurantiaca]|uniref:Uncharacterized protein n=1 Tax=Sphingomonas aurantiaca TaxID=185949 RepID=A0A5E7YXX5_9SPHN|nr:hypothetical protein SPHINGO391_410101 [Sphingomonas aurantiaca]